MTHLGSRHVEIAVGRALGTVVVTVHGFLDEGRLARLEGILIDLIEGQGNLTVAVDLRDADARDADGVAIFAVSAELTRRRGGSLVVNMPPEPLAAGLRQAGLGDLVRVTPHGRPDRRPRRNAPRDDLNRRRPR